MSNAREDFFEEDGTTFAGRLAEDGLDSADWMAVLRDTEPIKTDDNWCFDCDMPIDECACWDEDN